MVLRQKAEELLDKFYRQLGKDFIGKEKLKAIQLASQLILDDISNSKCKADNFYLVSSVDMDFLLEDLPYRLRLLLIGLFFWKKDSWKIPPIGQSIMQCDCPLSFMTTFSLFLGVHLHSRYGPRYLLEKLSQFENFPLIETKLLNLLLTISTVTLQIWMEKTQFM